MGEFRQVFAVAEFRGLWVAGLLSRGGDQLARVALAVLTYQRTGSATYTAIVYALTLLPAILGGPLLGWLADRCPRRDLMIACDLARTVLIGIVALPGIPLWVLCGLVFASQLLESPQKAARIAILPDVLPEPMYATGVAVNHLTSQVLTLTGFAAGGLVVAATGPEFSLAIDALTFAASGLIVLSTVRRRAASRESDGSHPVRAALSSTAAGFRLICGTPRLRGLLLLALLAFFTVIPEAIAVPYAASLGHGTTEAGFMMAAIAIGNVAGVFLVTRLVPAATRVRLLAPMAILASLPLSVSVLQPGLYVVLALWTLTGMLTAYQVTANAEFVRLTPRDQRGQALGLASSAMVGAQGIGVLLGGALVTWAGPANGLALAGVIGTLAGVPCALVWHRASERVSRRGRHRSVRGRHRTPRGGAISPARRRASHTARAAQLHDTRR